MTFEERRQLDTREGLGLFGRLVFVAFACAAAFVLVGLKFDDSTPRPDVRAEGSKPTDYVTTTASVDAPPWVYLAASAFKRCLDAGMAGGLATKPCRVTCGYQESPVEAWALALPEEACDAQPEPDRWHP